MTETKYKKIKPILSEEIQRYGKMQEAKKWKSNFPVFSSEIPYEGFKIILSNPIVPKEREQHYYNKSKYGWWIYCAKKDKEDEWDKKLFVEKATHYGGYREGSHSFCNDNMHEGKYFYSLHPNEMIEDVKQQIGIFYRDKEIEIARSKMTEEDYEKIKERAKMFLDSVVKENSKCVSEIQLGKDKKMDAFISGLNKHGLKSSEGWLVHGKNATYLVDETGRTFYYESKNSKLEFQPICIQTKWDNKYLHLYDHIASRILALINDDKTKKMIGTLKN